MTDGITVITNNIPRPVIYGYQLTEDERKEFDYINWDDEKEGNELHEFVRYKNWVYDLNDTEGTFQPDRRWFHITDTFFSGVLFRYPEGDFGPESVDTEYIICGRFYVS